jgi:hypothetical protein
MKKYIGGHQSVVGCGLRQSISFSIFGSLDVLYGKLFEVILHHSDEG